MHGFRAARAGAIFLLAATMIVGCGGSELSEVTGTITYDGKAIENGSIAFTPADGNGPTAGSAIKDGKYTAQKVPVGTAKVSIHGAKVTGKKMMYDDPKSQPVITSTEFLPAKYNTATELQYEVKPGHQTKDFDLAK